jgi:hypothetical protein
MIGAVALTDAAFRKDQLLRIAHSNIISFQQWHGGSMDSVQATDSRATKSRNQRSRDTNTDLTHAANATPTTAPQDDYSLATYSRCDGCCCSTRHTTLQ